MLVEIAGEILVLGTTAREMTLLATIVDPERIHRLRAISNPVMGRLGGWWGQWIRQASGKVLANSVTSESKANFFKSIFQIW